VYSEKSRSPAFSAKRPLPPETGGYTNAQAIKADYIFAAVMSTVTNEGRKDLIFFAQIYILIVKH